jgi:DNA-binding transcriptional ArsR family regulator
VRRAYFVLKTCKSGATRLTGTIFILAHPLPLVSARLLPGRERGRVRKFLALADCLALRIPMHRGSPYAQRSSKRLAGPDWRGMGVKHAELRPGRNPVKRRSRLPEEAPTYPASHRVRLEALILLHEGQFSAAEIARMIDEDVPTVTNHLRDLYDAGCIEFVGHEGEGNLRKAVYQAIARPFTDPEETQQMSLEERQEAAGVHLQWILAEALGSYRKKKMVRDETVVMSDEPCLDAEGVLELHDFFVACWIGDIETMTRLEGVQQIAARAMNRMAISNEVGTTVVASLMAFERARPSISEGSSRVPISKR